MVLFKEIDLVRPLAQLFRKSVRVLNDWTVLCKKARQSFSRSVEV